MSQRLTRKEIKRDEVREGMFYALEWLGDHVRTLLIAAGAVLGLIVIGALVLSHMGNREERAQEQLAEAVRIYSAPVNTEGADPDNARNPTFPDEDSRGERAKALFESVRERYGSTDAGRIAAVYLGEIAVSQGEPARARELWQEFLRKDHDDALSMQVRLNLIGLSRDAGEGETLATELQQELEGETTVPADLLLYELGVTLEDQGQVEAARDVFQRLVDEHPRSAYAGEARSRLGSAA